MLLYILLYYLVLCCLNVFMVLISGNFFDEFQCIDNEEIWEKLLGIVDYFFIYNCFIFNWVDDFVV